MPCVVGDGEACPQHRGAIDQARTRHRFSSCRFASPDIIVCVDHILTRMRVLLTEGSGLTSRQTATRLHALGHTVGVLSSDPIALTRFTRTVRSWHRVPAFGLSPFAWLDAATDVVRRHRYDLLFPTQEQVTVLSWAAGTTELDGVPTIVPPFESLRAVQDKIAARSTLDSLGIAQPAERGVARLRRAAKLERVPGIHQDADRDRDFRRSTRRRPRRLGRADPRLVDDGLAQCRTGRGARPSTRRGPTRDAPRCL